MSRESIRFRSWAVSSCKQEVRSISALPERRTHATIKAVTQDIDPRMHLNTAVSSLMELVNELYAFSETTAHGAPSRGDAPPGRIERAQTLAVMREAIDALVVMVSPFAPHTAEELWEMLGHTGGLAKAQWPSFDANVAKAAEVVVPVQVNGKVRARLTLPAGLADEEMQQRVLADEAVRAHVTGKIVRKVVVAKGPLVSIVVS